MIWWNQKLVKIMCWNTFIYQLFPFISILLTVLIVSAPNIESRQTKWVGYGEKKRLKCVHHALRYSKWSSCTVTHHSAVSSSRWHNIPCSRKTWNTDEQFIFVYRASKRIDITITRKRPLWLLSNIAPKCISVYYTSYISNYNTK